MGKQTHFNAMTSGLALRCAVIAFACLAVFPRVAPAAASPPATELLAALQKGGYVLVMRHAQSPDARPAPRDAEADNGADERQLSADGKASAQALGVALRALHVPIGRVYCSPTYRTRETLRLAGFARPQIIPELGETPAGMQAKAGSAQTSWLQQAVRRAPMRNTDTLIVTHAPNIAAAFGSEDGKLQAGEMLIFQPAAHGAAGRRIGSLTIGQWEQLTPSR